MATRRRETESGTPCASVLVSANRSFHCSNYCSLKSWLQLQLLAKAKNKKYLTQGLRMLYKSLLFVRFIYPEKKKMVEGVEEKEVHTLLLGKF